jgi:chromate transporter
MNPVDLFWMMLKASLFSTGGMGNVPSLHSDLLARGWATEREFAESLAVGQVSPGPNGLWVISLGYLLDGLRGAMLALLAICLPPILVLLVVRLYRRVQHHPAVEGFVRGLSLAVVGIFVVVLLRLLNSSGITFQASLITIVSLFLGTSKRVPVVVIIAIAALVGILWR